VEFRWEPAIQDSWRCRALWVPPTTRPLTPQLPIRAER
jgi:hypothetical protein